MRRLWLALVSVGLVLAGLPVGSMAATHGLRLGVTGDPFMTTDSGLREEWLGRAQDARASLIYSTIDWSTVAPAVRPPGFEPANPDDPAYDWATVDAMVRSTTSQGMTPVLNFSYAPTWAEGPNRPSPTAPAAGTWDPQPQQAGAFARALAERYSGHFRDAEGELLPRVRFFEVWAEENMAFNFNPLWENGKLVGPSLYRLLLNAAYREIHAVNPGAKVIVGGLAPYGDRTPSYRVPPVWYWRSLLCLRGAKLQPVSCPEPAHFDILAHNPIDFGPPQQSATSPLDVSTPNIGRITKIVHKALATGRLLPARPKPFWSTEIWWDSNPPDPEAVPIRLQARFITKSMYMLWRQGASAYIWWYIRDQSSAGGFAATQQSGLFFRDGRPKPAYWAFRFPLLGGPTRQGRLFVWGKAPRPGWVTIEQRRPRGWATIGRVHVGGSQVFRKVLASKPRGTVRARQGGQASFPWQLLTARSETPAWYYGRRSGDR